MRTLEKITKVVHMNHPPEWNSGHDYVRSLYSQQRVFYTNLVFP